MPSAPSPRCEPSWRPRLLKKAHLLRWLPRALVAAYREYASLGPAVAALHLDLFEQLPMGGGAHPAGVKMVLPECGISDSAAIFEAAWLMASVLESCRTGARGGRGSGKQIGDRWKTDHIRVGGNRVAMENRTNG